jgi:hypothetical protein
MEIPGDATGMIRVVSRDGSFKRSSGASGSTSGDLRMLSQHSAISMHIFFIFLKGSA